MQICRWRKSTRRYRLPVRANRNGEFMIRYGVLDTNVLVSAMLNENSVPGLVLKHVFRGNLVPVFNDEILEEYWEVLHREKFSFAKKDIYIVLESLQEQGISVESEKLDIELPDAKDVVFYEVVMEKRKRDSVYLVTGNIKHFPQEPFVVTPREMLKILDENDR